MIAAEYRIPCGFSLTVALVTDMHESDPREAIALLHRIRPDLICVAGDTFERFDHGKDPRAKEREGLLKKLLYALMFAVHDLLYLLAGSKKQKNDGNLDAFLRELGRIPNPDGNAAPVMLSLGNHEWYLTEEDLARLDSNGITLLDNRDVELVIRGNRLLVGGLSSGVDLDWLQTFSRKPGFKLLLCHHPEYYDRYLQDQDVNLILSGHAHGGQIRLWGHGLYAPNQGILPRYTRGIYHGRMVVSTGCANTAAFPRWGNPCEIAVLKLQ